jgi:deoxycytidylate deaminase
VKYKFVEEARNAAMQSKGVGGAKGYRLGATLVKNSQVVSVGYNQYKTHPALAPYSLYPYLHAESHAILRHGTDNCNGLHLYVARIRRDGSFAMAKPCRPCRDLIMDVGIRKVYYTRDDNIIGIWEPVY